MKEKYRQRTSWLMRWTAKGLAGLAVFTLLAVSLIGVDAQAVSSLPPGVSPSVAHPYDWLQFNGNAQHSGNNTRETVINTSNVASLKQLFQVSLPAVVDGAPAYLHGVSTPHGRRDLLFVTTMDGSLVALDAHTGARLWTKSHGPGTCKINMGPTTCYTTSSPAVDPNHKYVYSYGLDGFVHKHRVGDGYEIKTGGWPERTTRKNYDEKGSSALTVATTKSGSRYLYVANGGYIGDGGDYQGHVTAINLTTGYQRVFNTLCSNLTVHFAHTPSKPDCPEVRAAIWARPGVIYDSSLGRIFMSTGNGTFEPANNDWGDSVFALSPDGRGSKGKPLDSFTPADFQTLDQTDEDLGSTAPAILPVGSDGRHLAVQGGKDSKLRLIDLKNLSGKGGPGNTGGEVGGVIDVPQGGEVLTQPAVRVNPSDSSTWVFVANGNGISAVKLIHDGNGTPGLQTMWQNGSAGTSPILANGVLYYASDSGLKALDPQTGSLLWNSSQMFSIHWQSPIVANGVLYLTDGFGKLSAFSINGVLP